MNTRPSRRPLDLLRPLLLRALCIGALAAGWNAGCGPHLQAATGTVFGITGPILTGVVDFVDPEQGLLRVRCAQSGYQPRLLHGMENANFLTESGVAMTLADIQPGMQVTIQLGRRGREWMIARVLLHDTPQTRPLAGLDQPRGF